MKHANVTKATFSDIRVLCELLRGAHERSRLRDKVSFSEARTKAMLMNAMQRDGGGSDGSTFVAVARRDDRIEAVIIGVLQSIYMMSDDLEATDILWYAAEDASPTSAPRLLKAMHKWAASCPKVFRVRQANSDIIVSPDVSGGILAAEGLRLTGSIYEKEISR